MSAPLRDHRRRIPRRRDVEATLAGLTDDFVSETPFFGGRYDLGQFQDPAAMRRLARGAVRQKDVQNDLEDYAP